MEQLHDLIGEQVENAFDGDIDWGMSKRAKFIGYKFN